MRDSRNDPDLECMRRIQDGDDLALSELMNRWQLRLVEFIYRYTGDRTTSVDFAQETFVKIYQHRDSFRGGQFSTWLFSIASNLCRNRFRWLSRHPTVSMDADEEAGSAARPAFADNSTPTPSENLETGERIAAVKKAIQCLPHDLRVAIVLAEYDELSYREIAAVLNCSEKAAEMKLYRARKQLRELLEPYLRELGLFNWVLLALLVGALAVRTAAWANVAEQLNYQFFPVQRNRNPTDLNENGTPILSYNDALVMGGALGGYVCFDPLTVFLPSLRRK